MYNDENNQYNPRPRFDPKTGERIHYDDENTTETTQAESSEYRYSAGNIPFEQENNNTSYYQQSSTFQQDTTYQQAGAGQGSMNQQNGRQKKKKDRNKDGFGERLAKLAGSAAVFGVIAGAVMYGVYYMGSTLLPVKSSSDYNNIATVTSNVTATTAQSTSSASTGMDAQSVVIPLVGEVKELKFVKDVVVKVADELIAAAGVDMRYQVGTMIEIPRAALTAGEIAKEAEFFSFGTNDLTQMTFGFSRDDAAKFLGAYYENKIYESDPFQHLDQIGVGKLVKMAAHDGRETRPDLGLGICGEHGGDPTSVEFCHNVGLDYVSCSPFRVPIARLAAAQAAIKNPRK